MTQHSEYCRDIEAYLCRKNDGHLIRIVGPAFEQVCGWAERGVPLAVACRGIDRYCERYYAKGPRRRPVRVEFCEADILDVFDEWTRAVGITAAAGPDTGSEATARRKPALAAHIDRAIARLLASGRSAGSERLGQRIDTAVRELDALAAEARQARGDARARIIAQLATLDVELLAAAVESLDASRETALRLEAEAELAPFGTRIAPDARERAAAAAFHRLVREALTIPSLEYE